MSKSLLQRIVEAQRTAIEDTFKSLTATLRRTYGPVETAYEEVGGIMPVMTYTFRKPNCFHDVHVVVRIMAGPNFYLSTQVVHKGGTPLGGNLRPDLTPEQVANILANQVAEVIE